MARSYVVAFANVSISAVQDLIAIYAGASMGFEVISFNVGQTTSPSSPQGLRVALNRLPATVTTGSGGSAGTVGKVRNSDASATITSRVNDTVKATTSGTAVKEHQDIWNTTNGYPWIFPNTNGVDRPTCTLSEAMTLTLDDAPSGTIASSGSMMVRELL